MVEEAEQPGNSVSIVARKYSVNQLFRWRRLMREGALYAVGAEEEVVPASELKDLRARIRELERLLGKKIMEVEILKEAVALSRGKKRLMAAKKAEDEILIPLIRAIYDEQPTGYQQVTAVLNRGNNHHPHKGLKMMSPREYKRFNQHSRMSGLIGATPR
ncbi:MAG: transposase [Candidatus Manganitrophus sp. SA1]|nr:transposase [Candidatus Manganitrophus morganii]